ncbi:MAG: hypothetical protein Aureis2KO_05610 [Aureisphaera sp.]
MNGALFQELCDSFLILRNENYSAFSRSGSQLGNQKTIKGTPDTFLLLPNGKYIFVEYSTNKSKGLQKLKDDVNKCLDEEKTGIKNDQISEIILCVNFKLKATEIESLRSLISDFRITLTIYTVDRLALELTLQHRDLVHNYLNLPFDSGQVVSIEKFIREYNSKSNGIATPLDNTFFYREAETRELKNSMQSNDLIIITGAPGVGKTRLALEGIKSFIKENDSFGAYCISNKHHPLLEDLYHQFDSKGKYILFVDDANRIDTFQQIISFYRSRKKGQFKVIITVRDYAFQEIYKLSNNLNLDRIEVKKFNDDQIKAIIESKPFEILNPDYQKEIIRISDGNPRIAIMSSLLAKQEQDISVLHDVSDLFETYFSTFINDDEQFSVDLNLKCLGLISFFFTIPFKDREVTDNILGKFEVSYSDFIATIDKLDNLELVEIQYENVKIPEQNLATYFFYRAFIKDELLSFELLLEEYFFSNTFRFRDSVIPANNTFGPERVMHKLTPFLESFLRKLESVDSERIYKFLNTFWFYLQDETLEFVYDQIKDIETPYSFKLKVTYKNNEFSSPHNENKIISLLGNFFYHTKNLKQAISLSFLYVRKKPEHVPELIHKIVGLLAFDKNDYQIRYYKQNTLFDFIVDGIESDEAFYGPIFFELCKTFLQYKFHHFKGGRKNSFIHYDYPIQNSIEVRSFRKKLWVTIEEKYSSFPNRAFSLLTSLKDSRRDINKGLMEHDLTFLVPIIYKYLDRESLMHAKYVHEKIRWLKRSNISHEDFEDLQLAFTNDIYKTFLKIDWNRFRDKEFYDFPDHREYDRLKESEIRDSFVFNSKEEIFSFYKNYEEIRNCAENDWNYNKVLDIVIHENISRDFNIGLKFLELIISSKNHLKFIPYRALIGQLNESDRISKVWSLIDSNRFENRSLWKLAFFDSLDDNSISSEHLQMFIEMIKETENVYINHFEKLARFQKIQPDFFEVLLETIVERNKDGGEIKMWTNFFNDYFIDLGENSVLIQEAYLQQDAFQQNFDYEGKGLLNILKSDSRFLVTYVERLMSKGRLSLSRESRKLSLIWEIDGIEKYLIEVFNLCAQSEPYYGILNHYCNTFFDDIKDEDTKQRAGEFIVHYARENNGDYKRMNIVVDIVRGSMNHLFEKILLQHISLNTDIDTFSRIWWRGNGGTYSGNVNIGDIEAADWRNIQAIVEKAPIKPELIPINNQIKRNVQYALKSADRERQRRFLERDW